MSTLAARIRAIDPSLPPKRVADELGCCPRYVSQIRWRDRNRARVDGYAQARARRHREADAGLVAIEDRAHEPPTGKVAAPAAVAAGVADRRQEKTFTRYGSPSFAAWCQHWRNIGRHELARSAELTRGAIEVDDAWPPESAEVFEAGGRFTIPHGTPEWASHLAALRIARGARAAQAHELSRRDFIAERTRWGRVDSVPPTATASPTAAAAATSPAAAPSRDLRSPPMKRGVR